ncbi:BolA/IbaG family iron-sulfur metabolism protein [Enterobacteriaceae endosymbiont of Donacia tomentosa]|uniref:BolA family protein n=1 Tax=Enterobacteriaceae endosymbiont of Donacia tomentosa TaxID=2675787 RepID=UPI00144930B1|nr:BolA/IbaG family iron-sulfur metabolism protein [Enterobacteriaceae endosymbiont of Donacia tomentosa]
MEYIFMIINKIKNQLISQLQPIYLKINNNSHNHSSLVKSITHLEIIVVSHIFEKLKLINRHRLIYNILEKDLKNIHSLSLFTYSKNEWMKNKNK